MHNCFKGYDLRNFQGLMPSQLHKVLADKNDNQRAMETGLQMDMKLGRV
jgi:hypothetical protein